jgi:hypothetical protein
MCGGRGARLGGRLALHTCCTNIESLPFLYDAFRVEWDRAAWANIGRAKKEAQAKRMLLRWRLHGLLADLPGDLVHYHEAVLERDLRLLHLEEQEHPEHPFALFNLGTVYRDLGQYAQALPLLCRSVELSHPKDSIIRKLYALIAAERTLQELLEVDPSDEEAKHNLSLLRRNRAKAQVVVV